jgi:alpha-ribazole phosphatase
MRIYLIRHGKTEGNLNGRYIGTTDEPLCAEGINELKSRTYPKADIVFSSPLKRCLMTAEIIYPDIKPSDINIIPDLREMDFGRFENKSYDELKNEPEYQSWLDSGGTKPFPNGERREEFSKRCCEAFEECIRGVEDGGIVRVGDFGRDGDYGGDGVVFIVHGGTIMSIMEKYGTPKGEFYKWQVKNGDVVEVFQK